MSELDPLRARELQIAEKSFSTSLDLEGLSRFIRFPRNVAGKRILDIGAGASPAVAELRERGADAIGFDFRYYDLKELARSVNAYLTDPNSSKLGVGMRFEDMAFQMRRENVPAGIDPQQWKDQIDTEQFINRLGTATYLLYQTKGFENFFTRLYSERTPLVAGTAGSLPFLDDTFDMVYSAQAVSQFLMENDPDIFVEAVKEEIRVAKPYAEIQMHPWYDAKTTTDTRRIKSSEALTNYLKKNKFRYEITPVKGALRPRITIFNKS